MNPNTCFITTVDYHTIAYYSHLVPVVIAMLLAILVLFKSRFSLISRVFALFVSGFCLWLIGDVVLWTQSDYHLVTSFWAPLDYINVVFYLAGAYFFAILVNDGKKVPEWLKIAFLALSIPAWWITVTGKSITGFNQPQCEAFNSEWLTQYKLAIEWIVCIYILVSAILASRKTARQRRVEIWTVAAGLLLFFAVFSVTEYISSQTGIYEINLYSLFVLPAFLFMIIYAVTNLHVFHLRILGTQLLSYVLIVMVGTQFFFIEDSGAQKLTLVTFVVTLAFGVLLARDAKKEFDQRRRIERLAEDLKKANERLTELDKQKTEFVSFATHQLRSPLGSIRGNASMILEGDLGEVPKPVRDIIQVIETSTKTLVSIVEDYLNVSRIELGTMKYNLIAMDFKDLLNDVMNEQKVNIGAKGLAYSVSVDASQTYPIKADPDKFKQVIMNAIDNSIKYTPQGSIEVSLTKDTAHKMICLKIADTGVGIKSEVMPKLFQKFSRAPSASEANIHGTGLGLFIAKEIMNAHGGKIWAESAGEGKGSQFYVELPEATS
ncbi:MAG TPA: ATP-binding protein [Candidatus Paceibacterota bacterium]|jgi:Signal transduction histidine kinase